jgi:hypothetical protein
LTSAYNIRLDRHQQPQLRTMVSEDKKHEWEDNWSKDSGVDGEDYWEKFDSSRRYGYAKPSHKSCIGALASSKYSDALLACMLNMTSKEIGTLRHLIRVELVRKSLYRARADIFGSNGSVRFCMRLEFPALWMIHGAKEFRFETDAVRDAMIQHNMYKKFWGPMTKQEKKAELNVDLKARYNIAPYTLRMDLLDRVISAVATELKNHPEKRDTSKPQATRANKKPRDTQFGKDEVAVDDGNDATPRPRQSRKRARQLAMFKDGVIFVRDDEGEVNHVPIASITREDAPPSTGNDVALEDIELDKVWELIDKSPRDFWLEWTYLDKVFGINNDTRLRQMLQTEKAMADDSTDNDDVPVYELNLVAGLAPEDNEDW